MLLSDLRSRLSTQFGSDISTTTIDQILNDRYRQFVADSRWRSAESSLGTTVSGTSVYALPAGVTDIRAVRVGTSVYGVASEEDIWDLEAGTASVNPELAGVFAPGWSSAGVAQIELYPVPTASGTAITGLNALSAVTLTSSDTPLIDDDLQPYLLNGARADIYREFEDRPDMAEQEEAMFREGVEKARRRRNSRFGSGVARIRLRR